MFELPGLIGVDEVVVNEESVSNDGTPLLIYSEKANEESASA
jgi:ATP-dependent Clp protease ATP-binding subunit ClpX